MGISISDGKMADLHHLSTYDSICFVFFSVTYNFPMGEWIDRFERQDGQKERAARGYVAISAAVARPLCSPCHLFDSCAGPSLVFLT